MKNLIALLAVVLIFGTHDLLYAQITESPNPPKVGCLDTFTTTLTGNMYYWYFGPNALVSGDTGANLQSASTYFDKAGPAKVYVTVVTTCCGTEEDSLTINVQASALNITLTADTLDLCPGTPVTFIATPGTYLTYDFFIDNVLIQGPNHLDTFQTSALMAGDSVTVLGYNGVCYTNPSATLHPVVYPIPAPATLTSTAPNDTICSGDTVTLTATPAGLGEYWFYIGGSLQQGTASNVFTSNQLYSGNVVSVTVVQNGCPSVRSNLDAFIALPTPFITLSPADTTICQGTPVVFTAGSSINGSTYNFYINSVITQSDAQNTDSVAAPNNADVVYVTTTAQGCTGVSNSTTIVYATLPLQPLCLVSCDTTFNQNIVVWEKTNKFSTDSFFIYRSLTPDTVFTQIAAIGRDSLSEYYDATSQPDSFSYRYKINLIDICGNYSALSDYHQTIYLQSLGNGNFDWTPYGIENTPNPVSSYYFYCDAVGNGSWQLLDTVPASQTTSSFPYYAQYPNARYVVAVNLATPCTPTRSSLNTVFSNIIQPLITSVNNVPPVYNVKLLYNPVHDMAEIVNITQPATLKLTDNLGQVLQTTYNAMNQTYFDLNQFAPGLYYVKVNMNSYTTILKIVKY